MPWVVSQVVAGALVADFVTAAAHWFEDTYLPYTTEPGLLGDIARDNEMHHFVPFSIATGSWWDTMKLSWALLAVVGVLVVGSVPAWASRHRWFLVTVAVVMGTSNLVHRFQHERECNRPAVVSVLQAAGVLCSRGQHAVHHREPTVKYGVVLGFTNSVYDTLGVWRLLETAMYVMTGRSPEANRKPGVDRYSSLHDQWLRTNLARECPDPLTRRRLEKYTDVLTDAHARGRL